MFRNSNIFGSTTSTYSVNPINRTTSNRTITIEDINMAIIENDEKTVLDALNNINFSINQTIDRDPYRNTLLHTAIVMGNVKIIQRLIDMGADLKLKNKKGEDCGDLLSKSHLSTVIHYIAEKDKKSIDELKADVKEKTSRITNLESNISALEATNKRIYKEKQDAEFESTKLKRRNTELEESNSALRQATKKHKN